MKTFIENLISSSKKDCVFLNWDHDINPTPKEQLLNDLRATFGGVEDDIEIYSDGDVFTVDYREYETDGTEVYEHRTTLMRYYKGNDCNSSVLWSDLGVSDREAMILMKALDQTPECMTSNQK